MTPLRWTLAAACLLIPVDADAQARPALPRLEITLGTGLMTGTNLGSRTGDLRANGNAGQGFTLFATDSRMRRSLAGEVRLGVVLLPRVTVEGRLGYSRPTLETSVSADAEGAAAIAIVERVDQYVIDAGVVVGLDEMRLARLVPYVAAGAGYLRQLHEELTVIEQGHVYHLGGGLKRDLWTRDRRVIRAAGLRVDARAYLLSGGISLGNGVRTQVTMTAGGYLRF